MGGKESRPHAYPWTVALTGFPEEGNFFCGATIISSRFLVTAGHCFYEKSQSWSYDKIRVKVGVHNLTDKNVRIVKPKSFKRYEGFTEDNDIDAPLLDIALIELEEDLPVNDQISPICIHSKYFNYHINELKSNGYHHTNRVKRDISLNWIGDLFINPFSGLFGGKDEDVVDDPFEQTPKVNKQNELRPSKTSNNDDDDSRQLVNQPTDKHRIILDHPDKDLIKRVVSTVYDYYGQIKNDQEKIFDPAKEFTKDKLTVVGWGNMDRYESVLPDVLMETEIIQRKSDVCENAYGDDVFFRSKMICANDEGKFYMFFFCCLTIVCLNFRSTFNLDTDSCNGDSGKCVRKVINLTI